MKKLIFFVVFSLFSTLCFAADKTFRVSWNPSAIAAGAQSIQVLWLVNGARISDVPAPSLTDTSQQRLVTVNNGDAVEAQVIMTNSEGATNKSATIAAVVGAAPDFTVTIEQLD